MFTMVNKLKTMKSTRIVHWILTGLLSALLLMSASMYFMKHADITLAFQGFGFPTWIIYPLAVAKILGVAMILTKWKKWLTEWAYAGIFFNALLAMGEKTTSHWFCGTNATGQPMSPNYITDMTNFQPQFLTGIANEHFFFF